jgi:hypothetical protein
VWWISTTIFAWWIGNDLHVGTLSNLCGGYLPLFLHGGLEMILLDNNVRCHVSCRKVAGGEQSHGKD